jgi:hypothetical protein
MPRSHSPQGQGRVVKGFGPVTSSQRGEIEHYAERDIAVVGADSYANLHAQLMSWDECVPLAEQFCGQAGIPSDPKELTAHYRAALADIAAVVDAGFPHNTDLSFEDGRPVLRRRKGADRRPSALALEDAIHQRLPERGLLDILARTAHLVGWPRHFGPASGSDPKIREAMARYVLTVFANGTLLGPAQVARHMRDQVSAHELSIAANKHTTCAKIDAASTDVINEFAKLDVAGMWGVGRVVAADGTQVDTWENNILAESHIRYGGYGGIAYRHISDTYIALFSHFIPCGVWEAIYIIEGLLRNDSDVQPDTIHADTQGQSLPVFGLAALLGFDLLPRIRNWADLNFYRPSADTGFEHIDSLFGDNVIDWGLIETHWSDLLRTAISISEGRLSSVTLLRRPRRGGRGRASLRRRVPDGPARTHRLPAPARARHPVLSAGHGCRAARQRRSRAAAARIGVLTAVAAAPSVVSVARIHRTVFMARVRTSLPRWRMPASKWSTASVRVAVPSAASLT